MSLPDPSPGDQGNTDDTKQGPPEEETPDISTLMCDAAACMAGPKPSQEVINEGKIVQRPDQAPAGVFVDAVTFQQSEDRVELDFEQDGDQVIVYIDSTEEMDESLDGQELVMTTTTGKQIGVNLTRAVPLKSSIPSPKVNSSGAWKWQPNKVK